MLGDAVNEDTITYYFNLLKQTLVDSSLTDSPEQIYNIDEIGVPLDPRALNIVTRMGTKRFDIDQRVRKAR